MFTFGEELVESAREAADIATGRSEPARVVTIAFAKLADEWKADPAFAAEYERIGPEVECGRRRTLTYRGGSARNSVSRSA